MKLTNVFPMILVVFIIFSVFGIYVYIGTYVFPIAPYWVTQLPPNPPKPEIKYGEFKFKMTYSIDGKLKEISDVIVCEFKGFEVRTIGGSKKRVWSENIKNDNSYELFHFRDDERKDNERTYSAICVENIGDYKVILHVPEAEWFLGEPDYVGVPEMPQIQVYDTKTEYYLEPMTSDKFLKKHHFEVIDWFCDNALKNTFN